MHIVFQRNRALQEQKHCIRASLTMTLLALLLTGNLVQAADEVTLVLNDTNDPPFTTKAGDGFVDIVVGEAFRRAGLRLKLVKLPSERGLVNANAGIEDGDLSRIAGLEKNYPNLVQVPEKIMDWHFVAFTRHAELAKASWSGLAPLSVGYIRGWKIFERYLQPSTHIITTENSKQLFTMLNKDRIDVALYERWLGTVLAKRMRIQNLHVIEPPLAVREMFIYLNKRHADKVHAIATALRAIKSEGMYTKVCREKLAPMGPSISQCEVK